jgi:hypothetical protein
MPVVDEGAFRYQFPDHWTAVKFDGISFYLKSFQKFAGGNKAVDVVAVEPRSNGRACTLWLIEAKDYRVHPREKMVPVGQELAEKALGTLACLLAGRANAGDTGQVMADRVWNDAMQIEKIRFVFHFEQPDKPSRLFPQPIDPKSIKDDIRRSLRAVDPHPDGGGFTTINGRGFGWQIAPI